MAESFEQGKVLGRVQLLQELLGEPPSSQVELGSKSLAGLSAFVADLQARLRSRGLPSPYELDALVLKLRIWLH